MARVSVYVTEADRAFLSALPPEISAAGLLRRGIAEYRNDAEHCAHAHLMCICPDCGYQVPFSVEDAHQMDISDDDPPASDIRT